MGNVAVRSSELGKLYHIGGKQERYRTLRDTLSEALYAPFRLLHSKKRSSDVSVATQSKAETTIWALKDVSFEIGHGEVVGIIGRNGAGKSTLLKILSRITRPTEGHAEIHGRVASLLEVGTGFHPELTGRENVYLNGAILGMRKTEIDRKFDAIVAFSEIEKFIDTPIKHYSSGMHLRLAFAVAAHLEPEILIVDEVLAVGDASFQRKCLEKVQDISGEGRTVVLVSHNMTVVQRLCSKILLLDKGRVSGWGPSQQIIDSYLHSSMTQLGERIWEDTSQAPGNQVVRLRAVRAVDAHGTVAHEFKITEPFCIEVEFQVLAPDFKLDVGLEFNNEHGNMIFVTSDFQDETWHTQTRPVGIHRSRCHVPANLLSAGIISIHTAIVTNPHTRHAFDHDVITIRLVDDWQPGGTRGNYTREWPGGVVRPLMKWSFDFEPAGN